MRVSVVSILLAGFCASAIAQKPPVAASGKPSVSKVAGAAKPASPAKRSAPAPGTGPALKLAWQASFDAAAFRVSVADTVGDGHARVVCLSSASGGSPQLTVYRWVGGRFDPEYTTSLGEGPAAMTVGRFTGAPAAQIVTARFWLTWDGSQYVRHDFAAPILPVGMLRAKDGSEKILARDGTDFAAYTINPNAGEQDALVRLSTGMGADEQSYGVMRAAPSDLQAALPPDYTGAGVLGIWNPTPGGETLRYAALWPSQKDASPPSVVLLKDLAPDKVTELWRSPGLPGRAIDLCVGDPRGAGQTGLVALCLTGNGRGRALCVFVPERRAAKPAAPPKARASA